MWPFFRKKKETAPVPDWAAAFTPAEFQAFHDAIDGYIVRKNIRYTLEAGQVRTDESTFGFPSLERLNLMKSCKERSRNGRVEGVSHTPGKCISTRALRVLMRLPCIHLPNGLFA